MLVTLENQADLIRWAEPIMGVSPGATPPETIALGIVSDDPAQPLAVVCLNAFYSNQASIHIASNGSRRWLTPMILRAIFGYCFELLQLRRLNIIVSVNNAAVQVLALKLGFRPEGYARCGADDGSDGIVMGMLAAECPWIMEQENG